MIAKKTWREVRGMTIGYVLILEILLVPAILLFPKLRLASGTLAELMPMEMLRDLVRGIADPDPDYAYRQYMGAQMFFKGINIVGIAGAVLLCTALVARERENRTLEFLLSRPVSRLRILLAKFSVVALALTIPIFVTSWSAIPLSWIIEHDLPFWGVTVACVHASVFVLMTAAFATLCSVISQTQAQTAFAVGAMIILQAAIYFIQEIRVASVFNLSDPFIYSPILEGSISTWGLLRKYTVWPALATVAFLAVALFQFRRAKL